MRSPIALVEEVRSRGIELWTDGEQLRYRAPAGVITPEFTVKLKEHKAELIQYLTSQGRDRILPIPEQPDYEVSRVQRRIWVLAQLEAASTAYNIPLPLVLDGQFEPAALVTALTQLLIRHEVLRTTFVLINDQPRQIVHAPFTLPIRELDFSNEPNPEDRFRVIADAEAAKPFDLERGPLLRVTLVRASAKCHVLLLTIHHIISDGWSLRVIMKELAALYESAVTSTPSNLKPLSIQYRDYAAWQNRALYTGRLVDQRNYWLGKLSGQLPILDLPVDFVRRPFQSFRGAAHAIRFEPAETIALRDFARSHRSSVFTVLVALIKVLLYRYTGQTDIIVGTAVAGRNRLELEDQVGCYLNTLALRDRIDPAGSFEMFVQRVRQTMLEALDYQEYPFDHLIDELKLARDLSRSPLFDVLIVGQSAEGLNTTMGPLRVSHLAQASRTSKFDLTFDCEEGQDFTQVGIEYDPDLFEAERIARMGKHLQKLLQTALREPMLSIHSLPLLGEDEWNDLIRTRNQTEVVIARSTVLDRVLATVARVPARTAVVCGGQSLTFSDLRSRAAAIAQALHFKGAARGDVVGVMTERSPDLVAALLGVMWSGATYLPLDASYPFDRVAGMLTDSGARFVIVDSAAGGTLPADAVSVLCLDHDLLADSTAAEPLGLPVWDDIAYLIYTSGSTGHPKGVQVSHGSLANLLQSMEKQPGMLENDVVLGVTTVCFDIAALELFLPLCVGAKLVIADRETAADGFRLRQLLQNADATFLQATPATWRMLIASGWERSPKLRALCGGEALPRELSHKLLTRTKEVWNLYGPTETTVWSATHPVRSVAPDNGRASPIEPIGSPINNTEFYVLDGLFSPAPIGIPGELFIGGNGVARGYWNRPELTAEKFLPNPFSTAPGARMYRTGDLARAADDGTYEFLGRRDQQVKLRGFRIELGEIESALRQHPDIKDAVVVVHPDKTGEQSLAAYLVSTASGDSKDVREFLAQRLPPYMIPAAFVRLENLPLTASGKIDRRTLPAPKTNPAEAAVEALPTTPIERRLATLWQDVLGIENVGVQDNFFELGGHSLRATKVIASVQRVFGVTLSLRDLFTKPTIAQLAATIENSESPNRHSPSFGGIRKAQPIALEPKPAAIAENELLQQLDL
jgi:amino acid adenylation domain-containing protein